MPSYPHIVSTLALFVALGGSAAAATTLAHDSVGAPQIRKDAVRSPEIRKDAVRAPEIAKDAVRSPEIEAGAVRSSELRDGGVELADISTRAQQALAGAQGPAGVAEARVTPSPAADVARCTDQDLTDCPNLLTRTVGKGNWIVEAKLDVANFGPAVPLENCGLVQGSSRLDSAALHLDAVQEFADTEAIALSGFLKDATNGATVGLRCSEQPGEDLFAEHIRIVALQVTTIVGP